MKIGITFKLTWASANGQQTNKSWEEMLQKKNKNAKYVGETQVLRKAFFKKRQMEKRSFSF